MRTVTAHPEPAPGLLLADESPAGREVEAERIERWIGVCATVVVMLAGIAALLV